MVIDLAFIAPVLPAWDPCWCQWHFQSGKGLKTFQEACNLPSLPPQPACLFHHNLQYVMSGFALCTLPLKCFYGHLSSYDPWRVNVENSMLGDPRIQKDYSGWWRSTPSCQRRSQLEKVDSEVIFEISYGDNTRRIDPFKNTVFLTLPACLFPDLPCVVCKALAASVVCDEWGPQDFPCFNLSLRHTHSGHSPVWYLQVLAREGEQGGLMNGHRERGEMK